MVELIQNNMDKIARACNTHRVKALYLFGSAVRQVDFQKSSDVDFLVEFTYNYDESSDQFIEEHVKNTELLKLALEKITERDVDLLQERYISNKFLRYFINKDKKLIYAIS